MLPKCNKIKYILYLEASIFVGGYVMRDVVVNEVMKKLIISKEDFKKYFDERKIITKKDYSLYLKKKQNALDNTIKSIYNN